MARWRRSSHTHGESMIGARAVLVHCIRTEWANGQLLYKWRRPPLAPSRTCPWSRAHSCAHLTLCPTSRVTSASVVVEKSPALFRSDQLKSSIRTVRNRCATVELAGCIPPLACLNCILETASSFTVVPQINGLRYCRGVSYLCLAREGLHIPPLQRIPAHAAVPPQWRTST
ncbi:hypothetical protein BDY21DRAFT_69039 [Lineolata rhizophorae]|uniref:Uncharacterized protein n=1 Tax=Lineolata rhizophorae TaxID=578093 RepID=A0A6A6NV14_9PEZI|nr:hypothetical protein BDY21DRAFT_69039 [Lineolata rhizophorae]